jgi:3-hydroxy acid dehydrogenase / malonic semialdehyde reductase
MKKTSLSIFMQMTYIITTIERIRYFCCIMAKLNSKLVFITGASSGIGMASARAFAKKGANLILAARRVERLKSLAAELKKKHGTLCRIIKLDVRKSSGVKKAISALPEKWKYIDILLNNAGLSRGLDLIHEGSELDWEEMIDTNIKGLLYVSRNVIPLMVKRNKGQVINIGSIAGHEVYPKGNVYCATKHAVDAITKGMRLDLVDTDIRVTTIDPGLVETEFSIVRFRGNVNKAKAVYTGIKPLTPSDVADAILYAANTPENVVVAEIILLANKQGSSMVVHRK